MYDYEDFTDRVVAGTTDLKVMPFCSKAIACNCVALMQCSGYPILHLCVLTLRTLQCCASD